MSGTVYIGNDVARNITKGGFGPNYPILNDDANNDYVVIGHTNTVTVANGTYVYAGQQIATVGTQGNSTGCHVHIEVDASGCMTCTCPGSSNPCPYGYSWTSLQPYAYIQSFFLPRYDVYTTPPNAQIGRSILLAANGGTATLPPAGCCATISNLRAGTYTWTDVISSGYDNDFDYAARLVYLAAGNYTWVSTIVGQGGNTYTHQSQLCQSGGGCTYIAAPQTVNFPILPANFYWQGQLADNT
jgi:hypothetical protein